jgi:hypothetical protein
VVTVAAAAESEEDALAGVCLETLCELAVLDVPAVVECAGMRVVRRCPSEVEGPWPPSTVKTLCQHVGSECVCLDGEGGC